MTSTTVVGGLSGLVLGGALGAFVGHRIARKEPSLRGTATELGAILGGIVGGVAAAAVTTQATSGA
jgi:uncharacterized protein YqgC (DUF456 family)